MTVVKQSASKNATAAIKYARDGLDSVTHKPKCVATSGYNTSVSMAEMQFSAMRKLYDKQRGVQAHCFIQSFPKGTVSGKVANEIGLKTVERYNKKLGTDYQAIICTHGNTDVMHNHIVFNSVSPSTGLKYSVKRDWQRFSRVSDEISLEYGIEQPKRADTRETMAEKKLKNKGEYVWKNDLRDRIDTVMRDVSDKPLADRLKERAVDVRVTKKNISFGFTDKDGKQRRARGKRLGAAYEKEVIENELEKQRNFVRSVKTRHAGERNSEIGQRIKRAKREYDLVEHRYTEAQKPDIVADIKLPRTFEEVARDQQKVSAQQQRVNAEQQKNKTGIERLTGKVLTYAKRFKHKAETVAKTAVQAVKHAVAPDRPVPAVTNDLSVQRARLREDTRGERAWALQQKRWKEEDEKKARERQQTHEQAENDLSL